jgi:hypothetical protein
MKKSIGVILALAVVLSGLRFAPTAFAAERCFAETGFCIDPEILPYWDANGGLAVYGFPIGAATEVNVDGVTLRRQYFERHRIEVHPLAAPYHIQLGRVGAEELVARYGVENLTNHDAAVEQQLGAQRGCHYFAETGHAVCGELWTHWQTHGVALDNRSGWSFAESLALWGYPLSGEFTETNDGQTVTVQYFERARLERHPENRAPYTVLSGLLGRSAWQRTQMSAPEAAVPTTTAILPDSVLETFITNKMPVNGYWQASEHGIYSAASSFRYMHEFSSFIAPYGRRFVAVSVLYRNDRSPDKATEYVGPELYTMIGLNDVEYPVDVRYEAVDGHLHGAMVPPGSQHSGLLLFLMDRDTAPKQLRVQTNAGPVTIELRVWPIVP